MGNSFFGELDAGFAVRFDDVATHVGVALSALDDEAVVAARRDDVLPDFGSTELRPVRSCYFDTVFVGALYLILDDV